MCYGCYDLAADLVMTAEAAAHPPLRDLWKDYQAWHHQVHGPDPNYTAHDSVQSWGNVEEYLQDHHGMSAYDGDAFYDHPITLGVAKLHSLAQSRPQVDGYDDTEHYMLNDNDLSTGASLGLLKIRRNRDTRRLEPVDRTAAYHASRQRPWSDQGYSLQHHPTGHLVDMFRNFRDLHNSGEQGDDWQGRADNYAAELLDRHEAGDPEATKWADRNGYVAPDYMDHEDWVRNYKDVYPEDYPADPRV